MRDKNNISNPFQWSQIYFLSVAEVVLALLDSEEDSLRRPPYFVGQPWGPECEWLSMADLEAYHRQLFLWGWRFWLPVNLISDGPEAVP